jgi:hypothetical protein
MIVTSGWNYALFERWAEIQPYIFSIFDFIIPHPILTPLLLSPSCRRPVPLHTSQSLSTLKLFSADPAFVKETVKRVYPLIPATATASDMPVTRTFSRQLFAYMAAFLPTAPYFKSNDSRISAVCDDQYSSRLAMLEETADKKFKVYMTHKTQGCFQRWGCLCPSDAAASPGPGAAPDGAGSGAGARHQRVPRHRQRRTTRELQTS